MDPPQSVTMSTTPKPSSHLLPASLKEVRLLLLPLILSLLLHQALSLSTKPKPSSLLSPASLSDVRLLLVCWLKLLLRLLLLLLRLLRELFALSRSSSLSGSLLLGWSTARIAESKTSLTPAPVRAEHST